MDEVVDYNFTTELYTIKWEHYEETSQERYGPLTRTAYQHFANFHLRKMSRLSKDIQRGGDFGRLVVQKVGHRDAMDRIYADSVNVQNSIYDINCEESDEEID